MPKKVNLHTNSLNKLNLVHVYIVPNDLLFSTPTQPRIIRYHLILQLIDQFLFQFCRASRNLENCWKRSGGKLLYSGEHGISHTLDISLT
jgi:hypothetical protein